MRPHPNCRRAAAITLAALCLSTLGSRAGAQVAYDAPQGRVEVMGLKRWTLAALQDSIRRRVPGQTLADAACMVTLRDSLHFADALVNYLQYSSGAPGEVMRRFLIIKLIEPKDSAQVRWSAAPKDSFTVLRPTYAALILPATDSAGGLRMNNVLDALQLSGRAPEMRAAMLKGAPPGRQENADRFRDFLGAHHAESDRRTALAALRNDGPYPNRVAAAAVLANFAEHDSTWWALAEALRDGNEAVRSTARAALGALPAREVNWTPVVPALRALLGGTNVGATDEVMKLLVSTQVSPVLAGPLLGHNGEWVLTHLRAENPLANHAAHALLVRLNGGRDLGARDAAWAQWLATL